MSTVRNQSNGTDLRLAGAAAVMARAEGEIGHLWSDAMSADDHHASEVLAQLSHALHRAAHWLDHHDRGIG